ncbi:MAG: R3H domain-containing nucleic acid-binding protein [Crinalium sp.]
MSDQRLERGQQWLDQLLKLVGVPTVVSIEPPSEDVEISSGYWLTIDHSKLTPEQIDILIGPEGSTLDAIQYLANSILNINQDREQQSAYSIELDGYRLRRQAELRSLADHAAQQARETGREYEIKSLSAAERRQIHTFLQDCEDLETFSRGQEPDRRLVVTLR